MKKNTLDNKEPSGVDRPNDSTKTPPGGHKRSKTTRKVDQNLFDSVKFCVYDLMSRKRLNKNGSIEESRKEPERLDKCCVSGSSFVFVSSSAEQQKIKPK